MLDQVYAIPETLLFMEKSFVSEDILSLRNFGWQRVSSLEIMSSKMAFELF